jgi:hypothetical protein
LTKRAQWRRSVKAGRRRGEEAVIRVWVRAPAHAWPSCSIVVIVWAVLMQQHRIAATLARRASSWTSRHHDRCLARPRPGASCEGSRSCNGFASAQSVALWSRSLPSSSPRRPQALVDWPIPPRRRACSSHSRGLASCVSWLPHCWGQRSSSGFLRASSSLPCAGAGDHRCRCDVRALRDCRFVDRCLQAVVTTTTEVRRSWAASVLESACPACQRRSVDPASAKQSLAARATETQAFVDCHQSRRSKCARDLTFDTRCPIRRGARGSVARQSSPALDASTGGRLGSTSGPRLRRLQ